MGLAPLAALETAAQTHGLLRARSGFDIKQMASEYRALRASVLRLWANACLPEPPNLEDMIRFNEAIDQALAESIAFFSDKVDEARNLLLGMLGHDMRTPLQSILMTATYLGKLNAGEKVSEAATRLVNSGGRMKGLLDELVEFNRANLGLGLRVSPTNVDLADLFADELQELRAVYPGRELLLEVTGDTKGCWDGPSLQRLLGNLVVNAVKYGDREAPVRIVIAEDGERLRFEVRNTGPTIDQSRLTAVLRAAAARPTSGPQVRSKCWSWPWALHRPRNCQGQRRPDRGPRGGHGNCLFRAPASPPAGLIHRRSSAVGLISVHGAAGQPTLASNAAGQPSLPCGCLRAESRRQG